MTQTRSKQSRARRTRTRDCVICHKHNTVALALVVTHAASTLFNTLFNTLRNARSGADTANGQDTAPFASGSPWIYTGVRVDAQALHTTL